ncbi:MAG: pantetheine-phosphate adenylyltransferase [Negativibacillus sp.]|nr:pantetheine-phosphate adenylyltransferase [Negativibacillus sp.]
MRQERIAVVPGSFDPITKGHMDIIRRAQTLFDRVIVLVVINAQKNPSFSPQERAELIRRSVEGIDGIEVDSFDGLLVDYVREVGACAIVKGLRAVSDFEYEFQMALINKELYDQVETVFLTTSVENQYLSSSVVKQIASFGGNIRPFVPEQVHDEIVSRLYKGKR